MNRILKISAMKICGFFVLVLSVFFIYKYNNTDIFGIVFLICFTPMLVGAGMIAFDSNDLENMQYMKEQRKKGKKKKEKQ